MPGGRVRATAIHGWTGATVSGTHTQADGGAGESLVSESTHQVAQASPGADPTAIGADQTDSIAGRSSSNSSSRGCSGSCLIHNNNNNKCIR